MAGMRACVSCDQGAGLRHFHPAQEIVAQDAAACLAFTRNHNDGAAAACLLAGEESRKRAPG